MNIIKKKLGELLFTNLTNLIKQIKESKQPISNDDIKDYVQDSIKSEEIVKQIDSYMVNHAHSEMGSSLNLLSITCFITGRSMMIGLMMFLGKGLTATFSIFLMDQITDIIKDEQDLTYNNKLSIVLLLVSLLALFLLKSFFFSQYEWYQCIWKAQSSTLFQYLIYQKSLKIQVSNSSTPQQENGLTKDEQDRNCQNNKSEKEVANQSEEKDLSPDINNLITVDCQELEETYWAIVELVCGIISIIIVLALIYYRIGEAMLNGMYFLFAAVLLNGITAYFITLQYENLYSWMDKRVALSIDVVQGIKSIKYLGWERIFEEKIIDMRRNEFKYIVSTKSLDCVNQIFWNCVSYFMLYSFLTNFITGEEGKSLKDSNVFTLIALFGFLQYPLLNLPWCFSQLARQRTSFRRIQSFLNEKEIDATRYTFTRKFLQVEEDESNQRSNSKQNDIAIQMTQLRFVFPTSDSKQIQDQKDELNLKNQISIENKLDIEMELVSSKQINSKNGQQDFILNIQDLTIQKGTLNFVIGEIGSGKSAFLLSIINEMKILDKLSYQDEEGQITINGSIGFVSQNHWLQNKSIRENIIFGKEFDLAWYDRCIEACDLKKDFKSHPSGDGKLIGPGGSNLSGGQKQRVCLCRAIYQNSDIFLFDDIFSSLDTHVADNIFQKAIIKLLLKEKNKTILIVTSHYKYLGSREYIDQILYIKSGKVILNQSEIQRYLENSEQNSSKTQTTQNVNTLIEKEENDLKFVNPQKKQSLLGLKKHSHCSSISDIQLNDLNNQIETNEELLEQGEISKETILQYIKDMKYQIFIIFICLNILMKAIQILIDFWLGDQTTEEKAQFQFINSLFDSFAETLAGLILFFLVIVSLKGLLFVLCSLNSCKAIFNKLNNKILYSQMKFFDKNPVGRIISRLSGDINMIDDYLTWSVNELIDQLSYTLSYPIGIVIQFPWMSLFIIFALVFGSMLSNLFREANRILKRINALNLAKVLTCISETKDGLLIIRAFKKQSFMVQSFLEKLADNMNSFIVSSSTQVWMIIRLLMISNMLFFLIALTIMIIFIFDIECSRNLIALSLTYSILLCEVFGNLIFYFCHTEQSMISVERVRQYFNNEQEKLLEPIKCTENLKDFPLRLNHPDADSYSVVFENVSMTYDDFVESETSFQNTFQKTEHETSKFRKENKKKSDDKNEQNSQINNNNNNKGIHYALSNINIKIKRGEKIAFCGRTGSGKTSILNALFYLYKVQQGNIFINNQNIKSFNLLELRKKLSIIPQFGFLYKSSLQGNIVPDDSLTSEQIQHRLFNIHLNLKKENKYKSPNQNQSQNKIQNPSTLQYLDKIYEQEVALEVKNLDFKIDDGGNNLSNGEKQIVNFFRIVLQDSDIICLDEATSNMDPKSDQELHDALFQFCENKTLLVITHRLENIHQFDRVVVMEKGQIIECGHVSELMSNSNSFFNFLLAQESMGTQ